MNKIITLGDSIMQFNDYRTYPQTGWVQALNLFVKKNYQIKNFAKNGRSTKSFLEEKRFDEALEYISEDDLVIISFGHNDEKKQDPTRYTDPFKDYLDNLMYMVRKCEEKKAQVVLVTSVARRKFVSGKLEDTHGDYPKAMKMLATNENINCVDLNARSMEALDTIGEEESIKLFMNFPKGIYSNYPDGKEDNSHLRFEGAVLIAKLFYEEASKIDNLKKYFINLDESEDNSITNDELNFGGIK